MAPLLQWKSEERATAIDERVIEDQSRSEYQALQQQQSEDELEAPPEQVSRNVIYTFVYTTFIFAGRSIWNQCVLSNYVYNLVKNSPEAVGFITAVNGLAQLAASIPAGWAADKYRRDIVLKLAASLGILAITATLAALRFHSYRLLTCALGVWGVMWGVASTSLAALFADSIKDGKRTKYFTHRQVLQTAGTTVGPVLALLLFFFLGNEWTTRDCSIVMAVGQFICLPAIILLWFFKDDYSVVTENHLENIAHDNDASLTENLIETASLSPEESANTATRDQEDVRQEQQLQQDFICFCVPKKNMLPICIIIGEVASGLSAGLAVSYYPIFFMDNLHLNPILVQVLFLLPPIGQIILMKIAELLAKKFGRLRVHVAHKFIGIVFFSLMIVSYVRGLPVGCTCLFFILRTSFRRSTGALIKSALMDSVPSHERAKWSALESVNMFTWSGSAAVGGLLVKYNGIVFDFIVTGSFQLLAILPIVVAISLDEGECIVNREAALQTHGNGNSTSEFRTQLNPVIDESAFNEDRNAACNDTNSAL